MGIWKFGLNLSLHNCPHNMIYDHRSTFNYWLIVILILVRAKSCLSSIKYEVIIVFDVIIVIYLLQDWLIWIACSAMINGASELGIIVGIKKATMVGFCRNENKILINWKLIEWTTVVLLVFFFFPYFLLSMFKQLVIFRTTTFSIDI